MDFLEDRPSPWTTSRRILPLPTNILFWSFCPLSCHMSKERQETAEAIAEKFKAIDGVKHTFVDDFNQHGDFQLVLCLDVCSSNSFVQWGATYFPEDKESFSLRKITLAVKAILKEHKKDVAPFVGVRIDHPVRTYDRSYGQSSFSGYDKDFTMVHFTLH